MAKIITYKEGAYCQIKFDSGERILISIAQTGIKIIQQKFMGLIPGPIIYECSLLDIKSAIE